MATRITETADRCLALLRKDAPAIPAVPGYAELLDFLVERFPSHDTLEWSCTELREGLLHAAGEGATLELAAALAIQAFRTEYVFAESRAESEKVEVLGRRLDAMAGEGVALPACELAVYAAYRPLHRLANARAVVALAAAAPGSRFEALLRIQVLEPLQELELRAQIRALTPIADATSRAVQDQYEHNPYPRWHRLPGGKPPENPANTGKRERNLIAGCGTGRQALSAALLAPQAEILAVDLSTASLAYALRKAAEYGVKNVDFAHADILALPDTGLSFDAISCVGVVHHMEKPGDGLRALRRMMAHEGGLKIALYTESGRQGIVAAIRLRKEYALPATVEGIREFRQIVAALPDGHAARELMGYEDFYSVSGCRDLAFHVMEHRYTLPQFAELAAGAGLRIQAILAVQEVREKFVARYPDPAAAADIEAWHCFETENPGVFGSMYRFMLSKA